MAKQSISEVYSLDAGTDFLPGASILLSDGQPGAKPTAPIKRVLTLLPIIHWGPDNAYPQEVILLANRSPELLALIQFVVAFLYGGGLTYEVIDKTAKGSKPTWIEGYDPEVEEWLLYNCINDEYLLELIIDLVWFNHGFSEMIKNKKGDKIVQMTHQEAVFCRFGKQNTKGYSDHIYINAQWPISSYNDPLTIKVDCINVKDLNKVQTVYNAAFYKFMYPVSFPAPGSLIYKSPIWHSLFESGYYDVSVMIPILKRALMKFTMTVKYMIKVPQLFWENLARDKGKVWADLNHEEKKALRKDLNHEMNEFLAGAENAGKSFVSTFGIDRKTGVEIPGISVVPIDDKLKDGVWIEDGQAASAQFTKVFNLTPAVTGQLTGNGMGAGSGSAARVDGNMVNNLLLSKRNKILAPLNFVAQYNGWTLRMPGFRWKIKEFLFDTLDVNHSTSNPVPPSPQPNPQPDGQSN